MALFSKQDIHHVEPADILDNLSKQIAVLGKELASLKTAVNRYGEDSLGDVQQSALALAKEVRQGGKLMARKVSHQAGIAGKAVQDNPVPVIVALGTLALLSTLLLSRD